MNSRDYQIGPTTARRPRRAFDAIVDFKSCLFRMRLGPLALARQGVPQCKSCGDELFLYRRAQERPRSRVLVTGGSRGIGRSICLRIARDALARGTTPRIVVAGTGTSPDLRNVVAELESLGAAVLAVPGDLNNPEVPARLVAQAVEFCGGLDALVHRRRARAAACGRQILDGATGSHADRLWENCCAIATYYRRRCTGPYLSGFLRVADPACTGPGVPLRDSRIHGRSMNS
jgi:hypothetical protein